MTDRTRAITANDMHVITTQFIDAAQEIHVAMCLFDDDHAAQERLNRAMHSVLIGAEQCRQLHGSASVRIAKDGNENTDGEAADK